MSSRKSHKLRILILLLSVPVAGILAVLIVLHTPWGEQQVLRLANPFENATLAVEDIRGSWITSLEIQGITVIQDDTLHLAHADTIRIRHYPLALLGGSYHARSLTIDGLSLRQSLLDALPKDTLHTGSDPFPVRVDHFSVRNARFVADSLVTVHVHELRGSAHLGTTTAATADTLRADILLPGAQEAIQIRSRLQYRDGHVQVDSLQVDGRGSHLSLGGHFHLPDETNSRIYNVDLAVAGFPVAVTPDLTASTFAAMLRSDGDLVNIHADARLVDGTAVTLRTSITPALRGGVTYVLDTLSVSNLADNTSALQAVTISGKLEGSAIDSLTGTLLGRIPGTPSTLEALFTQGAARLNMELHLPDVQLALSGVTRPFDTTPTYDLQSQFKVGNVASASHLTGTVHIIGKDINPDRATIDTHLTLGPSRLGQMHLEEGTLQATLDNGTIDANLQLMPGDGGSLSTRMEIALRDTLQYTLHELTANRINVAALWNDSLSSNLSGSLALQGQGTRAENLVIENLRLDLTPSSYGHYRLTSARFHGDLENGRLILQANARLDEATVDMDIVLQPFDDPLLFAVPQGSFTHLNLATLLPETTHHSDINGTLSITSRGFEKWQETSVTLLDSYINDQQVDSAHVDLTMRQGHLTVDAALVTPEGHTHLVGHGRPLDDTLTFAVHQGIFRGLNAGALLGIPSFDTNLNGNIDTLAVRGDTLIGHMQLDNSRINGGIIHSGGAHVQRTGSSFWGQGAWELPDGYVRLDTLKGHFSDGQPTYTASVSARNVNAGSFAGDSTLKMHLTGHVDLAGKGATLTGANLDASGSRYGDITFTRLRTSLRNNNNVLHVDTLDILSNAARLKGSGSITFDDAGHQFTVEGAILDAQPLQSFTGAGTLFRSDTLWATLHSQPDTLLIEAQAKLQNVRYNSTRVLDAETSLWGTVTRNGQFTLGRLRAEMRRLSIPSLAARDAELEIHHRKDTLKYLASVTIDGRRDARLEGHVNMQNRRIVVETLRMHLDDDLWQLDQEAVATFGDNTIRVNNLLLTEDDQEVALDGVIDFDGRQSLGLTIYNFRMGAVADLLQFSGLDGTLNADLFLSGPSGAPVIEGTLDMDLRAQQQTVGTVRMRMEYSNLRLNLDVALAHEDESTLTLTGVLPIDLRLRRQQAATVAHGEELSFLVEADHFNVGWVEPFLERLTISEVEGTLTGKVEMRGTWEAPRLSGSASFDHGQLGLPLLGITLTEVGAETEFVRDSVYIHTLTARGGKGKGTLEGQGVMTLESLTLGAFDLKARATGFRVIDTRAYVAHVTGDVNLQGSSVNPTLTGTVRLDNTNLRPIDTSTDTNYDPVTFTERDVRMLENYFNIRVSEADTTTFVFYDALAMDMKVAIGDGVWMLSRKNPEINVLLRGSLDLHKEPYQDQELSGSMQVVPGRSYIRQFGRRFDIRNGRITFAGTASDMFVDFEAAYTIPSRNNTDGALTIVMTLRGDFQDADGLSLELASEPTPLDPADIISYIATGRPAAEAFQLSGENTLEAGTNLARNQLNSLIAGAAAAGLGLDLVEIRQEGSRGTTITAGKHLSRRLFASVSWPISFSNTSTASLDGNRNVTIEYEMLQWLLARLRSNASTAGVSLLYQYAY